MKLYQVHLTHSAGESAGYEYFSNLREACIRVRTWRDDHKGIDDVDGSVNATITRIEIDPTKAGILRALNRYAGHNDNG